MYPSGRRFAGWILWASSLVALPSLPIGRHPEHSRWFEWRGRAVARITSAEHYGAIINLEFNMRRYLDVLERDGLNSMRVFSGAYVEPPGAFGIRRNTLGPAPGRFLAPRARSAEPGAGDSGAKFDLECLSVPYLQRLREFIAEPPAVRIPRSRIRRHWSAISCVR